MRKNKAVPKKPHVKVRDGISVRVRFSSRKQISLVEAAAKKRGIPRDVFIQIVLQASAEKVLAEPPAPPLEQVAPGV